MKSIQFSYGTLILSLLMATSGCIDAPPFTQRTPVRKMVKTAAKINSKNIQNKDHIQTLINEGLNPNSKPPNEHDYLLTYAVRHNAIDTVRLLLENGADVDIRSSGLNKTPLFQAAYEGNFEIAKLLLEHQADVNALDDSGNNALREASLAKHTQMVELLLEAGCNPDQKNEEGQTMAELAYKYSSPVIKNIFEKRLQE